MDLDTAVPIPFGPNPNNSDPDIVAPNPAPLPLVSSSSSATAAPDHDYFEDTSQQDNHLASEIGKLKRNIEILENENKKLKCENTKVTNSNYYFKRKSINLRCSLAELKDKMHEMKTKFDLSSSLMDKLSKCASEVPKELFESAAKRAAGGRVRSYHPALRKFALSLHLCSAKAYRL